MYVYKSKLGTHSFDSMFDASNRKRDRDISVYKIEDKAAQEDHDLQATDIFEQQKMYRKRVNFKF